MPFYNVQHGIGERELNQLLDHPSIRYEAEPNLYSINGLKVLLSSCGMKSLLDLLCIILNEKSIADERINFEKRWNFFNYIRTAVAISTSFSLLIILSLR